LKSASERARRQRTGTGKATGDAAEITAADAT
jgi:hypothetical protein